MANQALAKSQKMLLKLASKPRNPVVVPALQRKAGAHRKTTAAERLQQNMALRNMLKKAGVKDDGEA